MSPAQPEGEPSLRDTGAQGDTLRIANFAQLGSVELTLGDLTVLVGAQATGKSLALQLLKLAIDGRAIAKTMEHYGLVVRQPKKLLARYLGEGMENAWTAETSVFWNGKEVDIQAIAAQPRRRHHSVYFVPAHRGLVLSEGYPPTFQQFRPETPFVVRQFSEEVRQVLAEALDQKVLFPQPKRLKGKVREKINEAIFHGARLRDDTTGIQRQLKLSYHDETELSYMTWTAGQREFIPLLLGLYYLLPAGGARKRPDTKWVLIEEPEMGLHPMGIMAFMLLALDLLARGYKVILSTHSPLVLDVVWAINEIRAHDPRWQPILDLFGITGINRATAAGEVKMAEAALQHVYRVFSFAFVGDKVNASDISSLDPSSDNPNIAGWGGLTAFSGRIGRVVADSVSE
jgi:hypothetical protein